MEWHFVLAWTSFVVVNLDGFIAYYLNPEGHFAYIPFIAVKPNGQHQGIGHLMLEHLVESFGGKYDKIILEARKNNTTTLLFYKCYGFEEKEDQGEKLLIIV